MTVSSSGGATAPPAVTPLLVGNQYIGIYFVSFNIAVFNSNLCCIQDGDIPEPGYQTVMAATNPSFDLVSVSDIDFDRPASSEKQTGLLLCLPHNIYYMVLYGTENVTIAMLICSLGIFAIGFLMSHTTEFLPQFTCIHTLELHLYV